MSKIRDEAIDNVTRDDDYRICQVLEVVEERLRGDIDCREMDRMLHFILDSERMSLSRSAGRGHPDVLFERKSKMEEALVG
jgi:hypothetical protein